MPTLCRMHAAELMLLIEEEIELSGRSIARCLGNAAEPVDQTLDAVPDRDGGTAAVARDFRAGNAFQFELRQ